VEQVINFKRPSASPVKWSVEKDEKAEREKESEI